MLHRTVTDRADHSATLVRQVDKIGDALDLIVTNWSGMPDRLRRALITQLTADGIAGHHAEALADTHVRGVKTLLDALEQACRAAKFVGDSHAVALGPANVARRQAGLPPISGVRIV